MDVDCSRITYETPPSPAILSAVERAKMAGITQVPGETEPLGNIYEKALSPHSGYRADRDNARKPLKQSSDADGCKASL